MGKRSISKRTALAALGAAGILAIGVAVPAAAMAARGHTDAAMIQDRADAQGGGETRRDERHEKLAEALAEELGLDKQTVAEALDQVRQEMAPEGRPWGGPPADRPDADRARTDRLESELETAVTEGTLTEEEAAAIRKAAEAGIIFPGGVRGHGPGGPGH